ncbi:thiamine pyrophosphate-dependent dehydrogenase E1 component subunit alpha [Streptomyces sp. SID8361]|uniref:thiamine pyrophosphate-dependent dehydrogenase E1 component subunit alpha n=1 Tax=Streptomyces sp. MnatMP-M27 TaxID=1839768 RepID=UPI00081D4498|nr:thiamine pyrophosphate-dependent dehydrogenase E1 component subunit alpha [Streptomyces sp. MnatMP-M27]MYU10417.1 thiamine pyrophosphate-dependent dehydrogenase E1 component subunit alpha [Streptomyces sp. SID8361]SCF71771.1 pyruvate dehydrogenase E1 component alpha subunit [Streptomyces sp. MnatMP-M27]
MSDTMLRTAVPSERLSAVSDEDLRTLLLIRHFETALLDLFAAGELHGTVHTCLGQEYVPVALRPLLRDDHVLSNHRGHGHYLARYDDPAGLLAEILGREGAVCDGVGGSQHIHRDRFLSTGVQGESLPVGCGIALHTRRRGRSELVVGYIGDGTWGEGAVYEALNMAALWRLPLLVVVENNGIAQSTPTGAQMAGGVAGRAAAFGIPYEHIDGIDINAARRRLAEPVARVRAGEGPLIVEFATHRLGPHSKGDDTRPPEVVEEARRHDWYRLYPAVAPEQFRRLDGEQRALVAELVREVMARPPARWTGAPTGGTA